MNLNYIVEQAAAIEAEIKLLEAKLKPLRETIKQSFLNGETEIYTGIARATLSQRKTYGLDPVWVKVRLPESYLETMVVDMKAAMNFIPKNEIDAVKILVKVSDVLTIRSGI